MMKIYAEVITSALQTNTGGAVTRRYVQNPEIGHGVILRVAFKNGIEMALPYFGLYPVEQFIAEFLDLLKRADAGPPTI